MLKVKAIHRVLLTMLFTVSSMLLTANLSAQQVQQVQFDGSDMALDLTEAKTFQKYPTYDQYVQMMQDFASDYPSICLLDTFGTSVEGRLLLALKISDQVDEDEKEANFFYSSTMHGNEIVGYVLLLRLADHLLKEYGNDTEITNLVNNLQIWINPLSNPDGSYSADQNLSLRHSIRRNLNDVDLNRDFPIPNKNHPNDPVGREKETRHMMEFLNKHGFTLSANIHSGEEVVNYPWDNRTYPHIDADWYRFVSGEYADEAMAVDPDYMFGWPEGGITHGYSWYQAAGTRQDYVNYYLGGREVTLELSMEFLLPSDELEQHWNINQRSLINYIAQSTYGIRGTVTDQDSGDPLLAKIQVLNHDTEQDRSWIYSSADYGDYYRLIKEGVYDLQVSANGYYDKIINGVSVTDYQATLLDVELASWPADIEEKQTPDFRLYPNPSTGKIYLELAHVPEGELLLTIHSLDGKVQMIQRLSWHGQSLEADLGQMQSGIYFVKVSTQSFSIVHRLLLVDP